MNNKLEVQMNHQHYLLHAPRVEIDGDNKILSIIRRDEFSQY
jgi:hypothetical protein